MCGFLCRRRTPKLNYLHQKRKKKLRKTLKKTEITYFTRCSCETERVQGIYTFWQNSFPKTIFSRVLEVKKEVRKTIFKPI